MSIEERRARLRSIGKPSMVHEGWPDVWQIPLDLQGRAFDAWITDGMSDRPMSAPDPARRRRELVFYAAPGFDYSHGLRAVADLPFENDTFIDFGHTIRVLGHFFVPDGEQALIAEDAAPVSLPHVVLLDPLIRPHRALFEGLAIGGEPIELLWVVPISHAEWSLRRERGLDALLDTFERNAHPWIFPLGGRPSYV
jgi:hypothetical protein